MKLEIGPGTAPLGNEYETVDAFQHHNPTYLFDIVNTPEWPIEDNKYEEVVAIHVLEHIEAKCLDNIFRNVYRILKPSGVFRVHVPNGPVIVRRYLETEDTNAEFEVLNTCIYGCESTESTKYAYAHKLLFTPKFLMKKFIDNRYNEIKDVTTEISDRHDPYWQWVCKNPEERFSLKVSGKKNI